MDTEIPELTQEQKNLVLEKIQRSERTPHQHDLYTLYTNLDDYLNFQKFKNSENPLKNLYNKTVDKLNKYIKNNKQV